MPDFNLVVLVGRLTRDPELKYIPSGAAVASLSLAINSQWTGKDGSKRDKTVFIDVTAWNRQAETVAEHLKKGATVMIQGSIDMEQWETPDGQKRTKHKVTASKIQFMDRKVPLVMPDTDPVATDSAAPAQPPESSEEIPF